MLKDLKYIYIIPLLILTLYWIATPAQALPWANDDARRAAMLDSVQMLVVDIEQAASQPRLQGLEAIAVIPIKGPGGAQLTAELRNLLSNTSIRVYDRVDYEELYGEEIMQQDFEDLMATPENRELAVPVQAYLRAQVQKDAPTWYGGHEYELTWNLTDTDSWNVVAGNTALGTARPVWLPAAMITVGTFAFWITVMMVLGKLRGAARERRITNERRLEMEDRQLRAKLADEARRAIDHLHEASQIRVSRTERAALATCIEQLDILRRDIETAWPLTGRRSAAGHALRHWHRGIHQKLVKVTARAVTIRDASRDESSAGLEKQIKTLQSGIDRVHEQWQGRIDRLKLATV